MNRPALRQSENPEESWAAAVLELRFLEGVGGTAWSQMADSVVEAEQLALLRIEQEEAFHRGQPFGKQDQLRRAEKAMERVNLFGRIIGARIVARMAQLAGRLDEEPAKKRFSDAAILEVFGKLPRWEVDPNDEEMAAVLRRFLWLGRHGGKGCR